MVGIRAASGWISLALAGTGVFGCTSDNTTEPAAPAGSAFDDGGPLPPILDGGGSLPEAFDGAALCRGPEGACNYQTGEPCPADQSCLPARGDDGGITPQCVAAGTLPIGAPCDSAQPYGECTRGAFCADGVCRKLCCGGDWNGCLAGEHCSVALAVADSPDAMPQPSGAWLCRPANVCDPLDPGSCADAGPGMVCTVSDGLGGTMCGPPPGTGMVGTSGPDPCPCAAGFLCVDACEGSPYCSPSCRRLCRAVAGGGEPSCPREEGQCVHFNRDPDGVGECAPLGELAN